MRRRQTGHHLDTVAGKEVSLTPSCSSLNVVVKEPSSRVQQIPSEQTHQTSQPLDPSYHDALVVTSKGRYEVVKLKSPTEGADMDVVIRTKAVGLNPID